MDDIVILRISTTGRQLDQRISKRLGKFPKLTRIAMNKWGRRLVQEMHTAARIANISPFGERNSLYKNTKWLQVGGSNYGRLVMPLHGVYLDRMKPHVMWISKSYPTRLRWALQAKYDVIRRQAEKVRSGVRKSGLKGFPVKVRPHPFIKQAYSTARKLLPGILRTELAKARYGG